jgi:DNA segregation ATPase FtsK/SpoIIIE-like protein
MQSGSKQTISGQISGIFFCAAGLCVAVSLAGYTPADPPEFAGFAQPENIHNLLGMPGALLAAFLLNLAGYAAYLLIVLLAVNGIKLLRGTSSLSYLFAQPVLLTTGLLLTLFGFAGLTAMLPDWTIKLPCPIIGPGGYSGTILTALLLPTVAVAGSVIFLTSMILAGLILIGDQTLFQLFLGKTTRERHPHPDGTEILPPPVRPAGGKRVPNIRIADADQYEDEEYTEYEDEEEYEEEYGYEYPSADLLESSEPAEEGEFDDTNFALGQLLINTLKTFKINAQVVDIKSGPVLSQYEIRLEQGTRIKKIQQLEDDLGVELKTGSVRIVAPIPGKNTVGVELPNERRQTVRLRDVIDASPDAVEKDAIPLFLGKCVTGEPMTADLAGMPHLLIAGQTGTGKSVCLNSIIVSILMTRSPEEVRMLMIDPKQVELASFGRVPHLIYPIVDDMQKAVNALGWAVAQMEDRYSYIKRAGVRQISEYNDLQEDELRRRLNMIDAADEEWDEIPKFIPYLVIVVDEVADLLRTAREAEASIVRLAQKARAAGIHLILATQKPTADAFSSLIKTNMPARIAFKVSSKTDSMTILDQTGAEQLLGKGDMLVKTSKGILRGQGALVTDAEIETIMEQIGTDEPDFAPELLEMDENEESGSTAEEITDEKGRIDRDDVYYQSVHLVLQKGEGSVSMLQKMLGIGYPRASRIMYFMEEDGLVGAANGSKPRKALITMNEWQRRRHSGTGGRSKSAATPSAYTRGTYNRTNNSENGYDEDDDFVAM